MRQAFILTLLLGLFVFLGCGEDDKDAVGNPGDSGSNVEVPGDNHWDESNWDSMKWEN